jgi:hypothetical protein
MKKLRLLSILLVFISLTSGCKKEESDNAPSSFSAKVESTLFKGNMVTAMHSSGGNYTQIIATGAMPSQKIVIYIIGSGTGTYAFKEANMATVDMGAFSFATMFLDPPVGQIEITKFDIAKKHISGTFSFDGSDLEGTVYHVTEGKFENVLLTEF